MESLEAKEQEALDLVWDIFDQRPLGCFAISMLMPKDTNRPMLKECKKVLDQKFREIKKLVVNC